MISISGDSISFDCDLSGYHKKGMAKMQEIMLTYTSISRNSFGLRLNLTPWTYKTIHYAYCIEGIFMLHCTL
jgi:hypothetical protein